MLGGALAIRSLYDAVPLPNAATLVLGMLAIGVIYVLAGIILVVRFRSLNEFLMPMAAVAIVGQLPIFYFIDVYPSSLLLWIPTSPPAMLIRGAFAPLTTEQFLYATSYSALIIVALAWWANAAFWTYRLRTES